VDRNHREIETGEGTAMRPLIVTVVVIAVVVLLAVMYLDATFCGIAALGAQTCPGD
jgi:hypothetical protein